MIKSEFETNDVPQEFPLKKMTSEFDENICDLKYLTGMMGFKKHLVKGIIDVFLKQIPDELDCINDAVAKADYEVIKNIAHTMKSTISIMGIAVLVPVLKEMEDLGEIAINIERIKDLNQKLNLMCKQAIAEIEREKHNYA